jgi:hypothetical protein
MQYIKLPKTVNQYIFDADYVNFEKVKTSGLEIDAKRLQILQRDLFKKFKYDLVIYVDNEMCLERFGIVSLGSMDETGVEFPLIKEFEIAPIDCFCIRSFHPTRFGGRLEVVIRGRDGQERKFFDPIITNIGYGIWDWCVDRYIVKPMTEISKLTGIRIGEIVREFDA